MNSRLLLPVFLCTVSGMLWQEVAASSLFEMFRAMDAQMDAARKAMEQEWDDLFAVTSSTGDSAPISVSFSTNTPGVVEIIASGVTKQPSTIVFDKAGEHLELQLDNGVLRIAIKDTYNTHDTVSVQVQQSLCSTQQKRGADGSAISMAKSCAQSSVVVQQALEGSVDIAALEGKINEKVKLLDNNRLVISLPFEKKSAGPRAIRYKKNNQIDQDEGSNSSQGLRLPSGDGYIE